MEDKQYRLHNRIPYLEKKIENKQQLKYDEKEYQSKKKLLPLEQNAMGKDYYDYLKEEALTKEEDILYTNLLEVQNQLDQQLNHNEMITYKKERYETMTKVIISAQNNLKSSHLVNMNEVILVDEQQHQEFELDVINEIEAMRNDLLSQSSKTQVALEQLDREQREDSSLYRRYEEQLRNYTHGSIVFNQLVDSLVNNSEYPTLETDSSELSEDLKKAHQLLDKVLSDINTQQNKTNEEFLKLVSVETLNEQNKDKVSELFEAFDKSKEAILQEFDDVNYPTWQKQHDTLNVGGSLENIIASNKEEYEKKQAEVDQELRRLKEKHDLERQQKVDKVKPKVEEQLSKLETEIKDVRALIELEEASTFEAIRAQSQTLSDEQEKNNFDQVLEMVDNPENDTQLLVQHLMMEFGGLKAVNDLSFHVKRNEIYGLIGPNGAGKTTVFNCLTQFYKPSAGTMLFKNNDGQLINLTDYKVHEVINHGIVRTFQNIELIWEISILDNMLVGAHSNYKTGFFEHLLHLPTLQAEEFSNITKAKEILRKLNLEDYQNQKPIGLPYGVLKRVELARTLMLEPQLIILDEPAAGLNESETLELANLIKEIRDEFDVTIFLVEHDMGLVMSICDRITAISFGKHLATGTPHEIQHNTLVQEAYLGGQDNE